MIAVQRGQRDTDADIFEKLAGPTACRNNELVYVALCAIRKVDTLGPRGGTFNPTDLSVQNLAPESGEVLGEFAGKALGICERSPAVSNQAEFAVGIHI